MAERTILTVDFLLISKEKEKEKEKIGVANYGNLTTKYAIDNFSCGLLLDFLPIKHHMNVIKATLPVTEIHIPEFDHI